MRELPPPSTFQLTEEEFRAFLITLSNNSGSMAELARRLDVSGQWIGDIVAGRKRPGPKLLNKLGAQVQRVYTVTVEAETNGSE